MRVSELAPLARPKQKQITGGAYEASMSIPRAQLLYLAAIRNLVGLVAHVFVAGHTQLPVLVCPPGIQVLRGRLSQHIA